jgi:transcriptional regulator with XRE-family HTH domain
MVDPDIGVRIAHWRRRRGLSQVALACLVGRSESWLSQVERGLRGVDRLVVCVAADTAGLDR